MNTFSHLACILLLFPMLSACNTGPHKEGPVKSQEFSINDVAKSDVDMVADVTVRQSFEYMETLAKKLYQRNPMQMRRAIDPFGKTLTVNQAVSQLFESSRSGALPQLQGSRAAKAISLAFDAEFPGDRVAAYIHGLRSMLIDAYGGDGDFYLHQEQDPQILYYLARNFEVATWRLKQSRDNSGNLYLLSNGIAKNGVENFSFERLLGKLIALQDHFAYVVADTSNRRIKNVIQGIASMVFFPI